MNIVVRNMEGKKVSFGFMKTKKADKPLAHNNDDRKDYIECVEEQSIKIVGGEDVPVYEPLVIPLKPNTLMKSDRLKEIALRVESALEEPSIKQQITDVAMADPLAENLTLDQMAERELLREAKKDVVIENPTMSIPTSSKGVAEGEIESTLDDYEAVPVQEFGVAMLRGMGWKPGQSSSTYKQPELRPKGLGLGAHKVVKAKPKVTKDGKQEELAILKNSFVKITCGKYVDFYGKVVSLDEENGRVMVDIPLKKETVSLSEFMMHVVTKSEYDRESKVINAESFDEYKRKESLKKSSRQEENKSSSQRHEKDRRDEKEKDRRNEKESERRDERERERRFDKELERIDDRERERRDDRERERKDDRDRQGRYERERDREDRDKETDSNDPRRQRDQESANGERKIRDKRDSSSSEERARKKKKHKKRYSSTDSLSSLSDNDRKQHKHGKNKRRSTTPEVKRDIDKKRKGKKKKRDRDRSPNYKKHRK